MLTYRGTPLRRIQLAWTRAGKEAMYVIETCAKFSCVVPLGAIGADGGVDEVIAVAARSRGNILHGGQG